MESPRIEAVIRERHRLAECPVWDEASGQLVYVDISAGKVCRWDPTCGHVQTVSLRSNVGSVALRREGSCVVAAGTRIGFLDWQTEQVEWVAGFSQDTARSSFNDGKVDPAGRFVAGTMPEATSPGVWEPGQGRLYTLGADRSLEVQLDGLGIPNGLGWSPDHRTFYLVDSLARTVRAYDYHLQTGAIANPRLLYQLREEDGMPDGLCVDAAGTLWVACLGGGKVIHLDPETGKQLGTVELPVSKVTSCCFGGPDYSDLYVTSASDWLSPQELLQEPQAGSIFKVTGLGVKGNPSSFFSG
ncbi:regucalcin-like [Dasypus novemcinctus]|uniref:regucalcin-like n=1 Tax=Dasypus novemcinctus TaxID=9361 RepID=UPI00265FB47C|nr:regucalcin-like [Dasypus novemcinctus]